MILFVFFLGLFRLGYAGQLPLTPDEAYYFSWSRDLAFCYYDEPGMVAWINKLFSIPWKNPSPFSVRLPAVLLSFLGALILYLAYREIYPDQREAASFIMALSFLPVAYLSGMFMVHDTVLFFFLILSYLFMFRIVNRGKRKDWYFLALFIAAALYSKFSAIMPAACFALFILLSGKNRHWLKTLHPYMSFLVVLILFLPAILWNHEHEWISVHAVSGLVKHKDLIISDRFSYFLEYLGTQLTGYSPLIWIALVAALIKAIWRWRKERADTNLLLITLSVPIWLYFFIQSFRSHVFGNWSAVGYIPALMILSHYSVEALKKKTRSSFFFRKGYLLTGMGIAFFMCLAVTLHVRYSIFRPAFNLLEKKYRMEKRIDWRLDQELLGWEQLALLVEGARAGTKFILARRYQVASILEFYLPDHPRVLMDSKGSRGSQFDIWTKFTGRDGQNALYIDIKPVPSNIKERFGSIQEVYAPFIIADGQKVRKEFYIYRCMDFQG